MLGDDYFSDAPWNEGKYIYCDRCDDYLEPHEQADPMLIDGFPVCDRCMNKITAIRIDQKIWEIEYDKLPGRVKHL